MANFLNVFPIPIPISIYIWLIKIMAKIVWLLSLAILINASNLRMDAKDSALFFYGFFRGLQSDPKVESQCAAEIY